MRSVNDSLFNMTLFKQFPNAKMTKDYLRKKSRACTKDQKLMMRQTYVGEVPTISIDELTNDINP